MKFPLEELSDRQLLIVIIQLLKELIRMSTTEKQVLADLQTEVTTNTTVVGSVQALVQNIQAQLAAALAAAANGGVSTEDLAAFQSIHDTLAANDAALANMVIANTPVAATGTGGQGGDPATTGTTATGS